MTLGSLWKMIFLPAEDCSIPDVMIVIITGHFIQQMPDPQENLTLFRAFQYSLHHIKRDRTFHYFLSFFLTIKFMWIHTDMRTVMKIRIKRGVKISVVKQSEIFFRDSSLDVMHLNMSHIVSWLLLVQEWYYTRKIYRKSSAASLQVTREKWREENL